LLAEEEKMKNTIYLTMKIAIGALAAIISAKSLGLDFYMSAGIITMLSLLEIKRKSLFFGFQRLYTGVIAISIASLFLYITSFSIWGFGFYLLIFIPVVLKLDARAGLVVNTVLASHIYDIGRVNIYVIFNEMSLLFIGITVALVLNLHVPIYEDKIRDIMKETDETFKETLDLMASCLESRCKIEGVSSNIAKLRSLIAEGLDKSYEYINSYYFKTEDYYSRYFSMRKSQVGRMRYMQEHCKNVFTTLEEAKPLAEFTYEVSREFNEENPGTDLLLRIEGLREKYKNSPLPATRDEFENRAVLFQFLNDLEEFIRIKAEFLASSDSVQNIA
jgi:uncharacterized membrane protein YgaE (UPF0421/DUF939 family)